VTHQVHIRFFGHPPDAHTVGIEQIRQLGEQHAVHLRISNFGTEGIATLNPNCLIFTPTPMDGASAWTLAGGGVVRDLAGAQNHVQAIKSLLVPEPILALALAGDVKTLLILGR